jgi:hypothetical protein
LSIYKPFFTLVKTIKPLKSTIKKICFAYLLLVPVLTTALAFIVGHVNFKWYVPFWLLNTLCMILATRQLVQDHEQPLKGVLWCFIIPWTLIAIFGGMGPPPETAAAWAALALEQVVRYTILIISGLSVALGFFRLNKFLANTSGKTFARLGVTIIAIALPLFVLNMAYWGYFLTHVFSTYSLPGAAPKPEWLKTVAVIFTAIRMGEVSLIYIGTAAFALALRSINYLSKTGSFIYVLFSCLGALLNLLPGSVTGPLAIANYLSYIPAFTLLMPYIIAINIARKEDLEKVC